MTSTETKEDYLIESVLIKIEAHKNYIVPRISKLEEKMQARTSFDSIINHIVKNKKVIVPEEMKEFTFLVSDKKTHQKVLDTYEDIYYNMFNRFYGRSGDFYMEKL